MHDAVVDADAAGGGGGENAFCGGVVAGIDVHRQRIFAPVHEVNGFMGWGLKGERERGREGERERDREGGVSMLVHTFASTQHSVHAHISGMDVTEEVISSSLRPLPLFLPLSPSLIVSTPITGRMGPKIS